MDKDEIKLFNTGDLPDHWDQEIERVIRTFSAVTHGYSMELYQACMQSLLTTYILNMPKEKWRFYMELLTQGLRMTVEMHESGVIPKSFERHELDP